MSRKKLLLTIEDTAELLSVSVRTVYRLIAAKKLRAVPAGTGDRRVVAASAEQLAERGWRDLDHVRG